MAEEKQDQDSAKILTGPEAAASVVQLEAGKILTPATPKIILPPVPKILTTPLDAAEFEIPQVAYFTPPWGASAIDKQMHNKAKEISADDRIKMVLRWLIEPSHVVATTGHKGSGKSHTNVFLIWFAANFHKIFPQDPDDGYEVFTNMIFKKKISKGKFQLGFPERVHYINNFYDLLKETSKILRSSKRKILVVWDEIQNFMSCYNWSENLVKQIVLYFGILRKLRQAYIISTPDFRLIPAGIRVWHRDNLTVHLFKDMGFVYELNGELKTNYRTKDIIFMEKQDWDVEFFEVGICPWNSPESSIPIGGFTYDHMVSGSMFKGGFTGYNFNFKDMNDYVEGRIGEDIPELLCEFFENLEGERDKIEADKILTAQMAQETEASPAKTENPFEITFGMTDEQKIRVEDNLLKYLAFHTHAPVQEITKWGLKISKKKIKDKMEYYREQAGQYKESDNLLRFPVQNADPDPEDDGPSAEPKVGPDGELILEGQEPGDQDQGQDPLEPQAQLEQLEEPAGPKNPYVGKRGRGRPKKLQCLGKVESYDPMSNGQFNQ
jgi:hypothetical protein